MALTKQELREVKTKIYTEFKLEGWTPRAEVIEGLLLSNEKGDFINIKIMGKTDAFSLEEAIAEREYFKKNKRWNQEHVEF